MTTLRIRTTSPQVHLAATVACRNWDLRRAYVTALLAGSPDLDIMVEGAAEGLQAVGFEVRRKRTTLLVGAGAVDVETPWRAARAHVRRYHEELHAYSLRPVVAALKGVETRRIRHAERVAVSADLADLVL